MAEFRPFVPNATDFHPEEISDADNLRAGGLNSFGNITMNSNAITGLANPTNAQDAATKSYVDGVASGLDIKESVRLATAAALPANTAAGSGIGKTLTADANGALTVDGVAVVLNDRILVKDETAGADVDHGIYEVTQVGDAGNPFILTRTTDFDENAEVTAGAFCFVEEGTANADTGWVVTTDDPITVDTTAIAWTQFSGAGVFVGGDGIDITGNVISVDLAAISGLEFVTGQLRIDVANTAELSIDANGLNVEGLPALFQIAGVAVGATVTAANLDTLTDGSNADALHVHAAQQNPQFTVGTGGVTIGDAVFVSANDTVEEADAAVDLEARGYIGLADATVAATGTVGVATEGDIVTPATIGGAPAAGNLVYIANGGGLTVTRPAASGDNVVVIGKMKNATDVFVGPGQFLGKVA